MQHSKCFGLIKHLTAAELRKAEQFLASPYFNSSKILLKLFRYIRKYLSRPTHPKFSKLETFCHLYSREEPFNENNLRIQLSRLTKLLKEFLVNQELKKEEGIFSQLLIKCYSQKDSYHTFAYEIEERIKAIKKKPIRDASYYQELMWLNQELFFHPDTPRTETGGASISEIMNCVDSYFVLNKLEYASEMYTRQEVLSEQHQMHLLQEATDLGHNHLAKQNKLIDLYIQVIHLQENGLEEGSLQKCIHAFLDYAHLMEKFEKTRLLHKLINSTLTVLNTGRREFLPHVVRMYKIAVNNDLMHDKGKIAYTTFMNVAILGAAAREFLWTKDFIEQFSPMIDEAYRDYTIKIAWAFWYYQRGFFEDNLDDYEKAIYYLSLISYTSIPINLRIRSLLLRIYYDYQLSKKNNADILLDHLDAFDKYIIRNQTISSNRSEGYHNLIKITRNLVRLKNNKKQHITEKIQAFKREIQQTENVVLRLWLLEKVEELF